MEDAPWYEQFVIPALLRHARTTYGHAMRAALAEAGYDDIPANGLYIIGALALGELTRRSRPDRRAWDHKTGAGQLVDTLVMRGYLSRSVDRRTGAS